MVIAINAPITVSLANFKRWLVHDFFLVRLDIGATIGNDRWSAIDLYSYGATGFEPVHAVSVR